MRAVPPQARRAKSISSASPATIVEPARIGCGDLGERRQAALVALDRDDPRRALR